MNPPTTTGSLYKPSILYQLEWCRVDRAAALLECEVSDLLHLEEFFKIDLYWDFKGQPATIILGGDSFDDIYDSNDGLCFDNGAYLKPVNAGLFDDIYEIYSEREYCYEEGFGEIEVCMFGLWSARARIMCEPGQQIRFRKYNVDFYMPIQWQKPSAEEMYIMRSDLIRVSDAVAKGGRLGGCDSLPRRMDEWHQDNASTAQTNERKPRESAKPHRVIAEMLSAAGFTPEDFRGPIPALQAKLAHKGLSAELTRIDEKTLADWLRRAGVR